MKKLLVIVAMAAFAVSCGDSMPKLKPEETKIKGKLSDYYQVVDKEYKVVCEGEYIRTYILPIEIQRTDKKLPFDAETATYYNDSDDDYKTYVGFGIEILDKKGNIVKTVQATGYNWYGSDVENLLSVEPNETGVLRWQVEKDELPKIKSFRITSAMKENTKITSSDVSSSSSSKSSGNNWDSVLDEYENMVNKYISLYKKAMEGDMSAISDYASVLESAEALESKLENASSNFTSAQAARYARIVSKLANAM